MVIRTNRIAPVASVFASRATASFPADRFAAMIPEPITPAKRKNEPTPSATSLRPSGGMSGSDGIRVRLFSLPQLRNGSFSTHCGLLIATRTLSGV